MKTVYYLNTFSESITSTSPVALDDDSCAASSRRSAVPSLLSRVTTLLLRVTTCQHTK